MKSILDQIKPETAEVLAARAQARGLSVDEYLRGIIGEATQREPQPLSPEDKSRRWREWITNHSVQCVVADDSREAIYREREDRQL